MLNLRYNFNHLPGVSKHAGQLRQRLILKEDHLLPQRLANGRYNDGSSDEVYGDSKTAVNRPQTAHWREEESDLTASRFAHRRA